MYICIFSLQDRCIHDDDEHEEAELKQTQSSPENHLQIQSVPGLILLNLEIHMYKLDAVLEMP